MNGNTAFNKIATDFDDLSTSLRDRDYYFVAIQSSWARYDNVDLSGISSLTARIANGVTGKLEFRVGSPTGTKIAEVNSNNTGWRNFANYNSSVSGSNGIVTLYFVGTGGHGGVIDYVDFKTTGGSTGRGGATRSVPDAGIRHSKDRLMMEVCDQSSVFRNTPGASNQQHLGGSDAGPHGATNPF